MSQPKSHKREMVLSPADAADLLRKLADQLDAGGAELGQIQVETDGPVKIRQSVKAKPHRVSFKLKLKYATPLTPSLSSALGEMPEVETEAPEKPSPVTGAEPTVGAPPVKEPAPPPADQAPSQTDQASFKAVKRDMSQGFKAIKKALAEDSLPPAEVISAFAASCGLMTTFEDKGEPKYQDFLHHVGDLKAAAQAGDAKALARAIAEIGAMKKSCHTAFK